MYGNIPMNLVFDDDDLDRVLYGKRGAGPTPADVLDAAHKRKDFPDAWRKALVAILVRDPEKGRSLGGKPLARLLDLEERAVAESGGPDSRQALTSASLYRAARRPAEAEAAYRRALAVRVGPEALSVEDRQRAVNGFVHLLRELKRDKEAAQELAIEESMQLLDGSACEELILVRALALKLVLAERYADAEQLYRWLLTRGFQVPGTWVHLARALLMQDRIAEARTAVGRAWRHLRKPGERNRAPHYVRPRLLFIGILFAMLAGKPCARPIRRLKQELAERPKQEPWTIGPVLEHLSAQLSRADREVLEVIAEAINDASRPERLDAFAVRCVG